ncbi:hypothetical protein FSP39_021079 [Pinctada imbricata]|uniref:C3H1-type domain-containing protein n=1 Tax=Pinctada imbricata TaxID=66713 RepID=A0AA89CDI3_PINIB|nr:hypothetical protein FSP39_021079 [Pinctada imbricata]
MHDIRVGAERGGNFIKYDEQFRLRLSINSSLSWANMDTELWLTYMSNTNQPTANNTAYLAQQKCYDYNLSGRCTRSGCTYAHLCMKCNKPHAVIQCFYARPYINQINRQQSITPQANSNYQQGKYNQQSNYQQNIRYKNHPRQSNPYNPSF